MGNMSASDLDVADRTKFDKVMLQDTNRFNQSSCVVVCSFCTGGLNKIFLLQIFEQVLSELEPLCLAEQDFISKFFKLQQHPMVSPPLAQVNLQ